MFGALAFGVPVAVYPASGSIDLTADAAKSALGSTALRSFPTILRRLHVIQTLLSPRLS